MNMVQCPHCKSERILRPRIHRDVVAVMPCPACHELAVMFRDVVIPLDRQIIENGSNEARAEHFGKVIAAFLDEGITPFQMGDTRRIPGFLTESGEDDPGEITEKEMEKFVKVELKALDDPRYFKKYFG